MPFAYQAVALRPHLLQRLPNAELSGTMISSSSRRPLRAGAEKAKTPVSAIHTITLGPRPSLTRDPGGAAAKRLRRAEIIRTSERAAHGKKRRFVLPVPLTRHERRDHIGINDSVSHAMVDGAR
jgi:hypothetical protein